jgi:hypothetical protein
MVIRINGRRRRRRKMIMSQLGETPLAATDVREMNR